MSEKVTPWTYEMQGESITKYKTSIIQSLEFEMYKNKIDQEQTVQNILEIVKEGEMAKLESRLGTIQEGRAALDTKKKEDRIKDKQLDTEQRGIQFQVSQLFDTLNTLYREVVAAGKKNQAIIAEIEFTKQFDPIKNTRLPFIEIERTRYKATPENDIELDAEGGKILYLQPEAPVAGVKKTGEKR